MRIVEIRGALEFDGVTEIPPFRLTIADTCLDVVRLWFRPGRWQRTIVGDLAKREELPDQPRPAGSEADALPVRSAANNRDQDERSGE